MSGLEISALILGVLPVATEILKSYSFVRNTLHACRHYSDEIEEISARLNCARAYFNNEVQLLRRLLKSKTQVIDSDDDAQSALEESYKSCMMTLDRTRKLLDDMQMRMVDLDKLLANQPLGQKRTKLYAITKIAFDGSKYESLLRKLRERNHELTEFREQIEALKRTVSEPTAICIQHKPLPTHFCAIKRVSRHLHFALSEAKYCKDNRGRKHTAKLCLDADVTDEVHLDLAISCQAPQDESNDSTSEAHVWLYVRSSTEFRSTSTQTLSRTSVGQNFGQDSISQRSSRNSFPDRPVTVKKEASADPSSQSNRGKQLKKIHRSSLPSTVPAPDDSADDRKDLLQTNDICQFLSMHTSVNANFSGLHFVGFLQNPGIYRHSFYLRERTERPDPLFPRRDFKVQSIGDALQQDVYEFIGQVDQLRIAHKLAIAVLQYNETPWLPDHWRILDLKYLGSSAVMNPIALKTLHLNSDINKQPNAAQMARTKQVKDAVSNQTRYGINNSTLFCLGVALLEIAYWSPIEAKATKHDEKNPVLTARRLQEDRIPPLGHKFQKITKQCLSCDFGFGGQLSEKGLQSAVYTNVVCGLEDLIEEFNALGIR